MKTTTNLGLKKPEGTDVVNIDDFNYNADIIDVEMQKRALKTDIPTVPVQSVNGKTGVVSLAATDVGAATSAQGAKAETAIQSSQLGKAGGPAKHDDFTTHLADTMYQTAGGTGTAITLAISGTLVTGYPITFIASANNSGSATTINGKPLYKPGTTTTPKLIAGKAYTVWYNATANNGNGCFFIKASAEGNTIASHVLAGDTFSNDEDTGLVGTAPLKGNNPQAGYEMQIGVSTSGGNVFLKAPAGIYLQDTWIKYANDENCIPANIISGKSILGVAGTTIGVNPVAGETLIYNKTVEGTIYNDVTAPRLYDKKIQMNYSGTIRTKFTIKAGNGGTAYGRIFKNGVPYGTLRSTTSTTYVQFVEDLACNAGDYFQFDYWTNGVGFASTNASQIGIATVTTLQYTVI